MKEYGCIHRISHKIEFGGKARPEEVKCPKNPFWPTMWLWPNGRWSQNPLVCVCIFAQNGLQDIYLTSIYPKRRLGRVTEVFSHSTKRIRNFWGFGKSYVAPRDPCPKITKNPYQSHKGVRLRLPKPTLRLVIVTTLGLPKADQLMFRFR